MTEYILVGSGGFALEIAEYIKDKDLQLGALNKTAIVSDVLSQSHSRFDDLCSVLGYTPQFHTGSDTLQSKVNKQVLICLGSPEDRDENFKQLKNLGFDFGTFVHETAWVARSAEIAEGTVICPFSFIGAKAKIAENCVVNTRATVGHDAVIGRSSVLSPHSDMNGASKCGASSFLGAGVILDPKASIGDLTKVASGSVVKGKFGDGFLLAGNPANGRQMFRIKSNKRS